MSYPLGERVAEYVCLWANRRSARWSWSTKPIWTSVIECLVLGLVPAPGRVRRMRRAWFGVDPPEPGRVLRTRCW